MGKAQKVDGFRVAPCLLLERFFTHLREYGIRWPTPIRQNAVQQVVCILLQYA
jgi:hypothetical protein